VIIINVYQIYFFSSTVITVGTPHHQGRDDKQMGCIDLAGDERRDGDEQ